ncbi:DNA cytosine methyltransferase, partial [Micrococcus sp. SIMBA_131]
MMRWKLFPQWKACWEALGYSLSLNVLDSADFGIPQHRIRMFMIGTRSRNPIELKLEKKPHVVFDSIFDLNSGKWSRIDKPGRAQ